MRHAEKVELAGLHASITILVKQWHVTGMPDCPGPVEIPRDTFRRWLQLGQTPSIVIPHRRGFVTVPLREAK